MKLRLSNLKKLKVKPPNQSVWQWLQDIKQKVLSFDIKPARPIIPQLQQQAIDAIQAKDYLLTEKILKKLFALNHTNYTTLYMAIDFRIRFGHINRAKNILQQALKSYPNDYYFNECLAQIYSRHGNLVQATKYYKKALTLNPDSEFLEHLLNASMCKNTNIAPRNYIIKLFDEYAENFENSLVETLSYTAHIELAKFMQQKIQIQRPITSALDLGCGTGLCGQELIKHFKVEHLTGVDLSNNMLEHAKEKNIYHVLHNVDLVEYLRMADTNQDLIVSTDVLIYLGDLAPVFENCYRILAHGGYFGFSTEKLSRGSFKLAPTGRYQHSLQHIKSLSKRYQYSKIYSQPIDLRKESGNMVAGYLVLLQK